MPELQENGQLRPRAARSASSRRSATAASSRPTCGASSSSSASQSLAADGVQVSDAEVEERYRLDHERVRLAFVRVPAAELEAGITLTDEDLASYHQEQGERYRVPTRVRARYVAYRAVGHRADRSS